MSSTDAVTLPTEMLSFVLRHGELLKAGLRLGQLAVQGLPLVSTPSFVVPTSRGVVPHVTQDLMSKVTRIPAVYIGLEDFIEKTPSKAPIFHQKSSARSKIRDFIALPENCISILGPRRIPAVETPNQNSNSAIAISTSVGFHALPTDDYVECAQRLCADITIGLADVVTTNPVSQKRLEKSADRTHAWTRDTLAARAESDDGSNAAFFASIPPLEPHQQSFYLSDLSEEYRADVAGVTLYTPESATYVPETLKEIPRLCLTNPKSPHDILRAIALGNDLITASFITETSENGIAMAFSLEFMSEIPDQALGFDLWSIAHAADLSPLLDGCQCYTCTKHHRAYLHHLLSAKEMLAWTLLQIHNLHTIEVFFQQIRKSIQDGMFEEKIKAFSRAYAAGMPKATGEGPRIRGYQTKSVGGEPRKNKKAYGRLEEHARKLEEAESGVAMPETNTDGEDLEKHGLGEVQS